MANNPVVLSNKPSLIAVMAERYGVDGNKFLDTVKKTIMPPNSTTEELMAVLMVANQYNLNPFTREIYAFKGKNGQVVPVVGVDGYVSKITGNRDFDGMEVEYSDEIVQQDDDAKPCPSWCEVRIYRKSVERPTIAREYLDEVYRPAFETRNGKVNGPWQSHTKRMLRHKTIIQAGRIAFGLTGFFDDDEARRIIETSAEYVPAGKPYVEMPTALPESSETRPPVESDGVSTPPAGEDGSPPEKTESEGKYITEKQRKRLFAIGKERGLSSDEIKKLVTENFDIRHVDQIPIDDYDAIVSMVQEVKAEQVQ